MNLANPKLERDKPCAFAIKAAVEMLGSGLVVLSLW